MNEFIDKIGHALSDEGKKKINLFLDSPGFQMTATTWNQPKAYYPPSPTIAKFLAAPPGVHILSGPLGSSKTIATFFRNIAVTLHPVWGLGKSKRDGWRRASILVLRRTEGEVIDGEEKSFHEWFKKIETGDHKNWFEGKRSHIIRINDLKTEIEFKFEGTGEDIKDFSNRMRSRGFSGANIGECDWASPDIFSAILPRIGRYPSIENGGGTGIDMVGATNAYPINHFFYDIFDKNGEVVEKLDNNGAALIKGFARGGDKKIFTEDYDDGEERLNFDYWLWRQPPAVFDDGKINPNADNLKNLPKNYYARILRDLELKAAGSQAKFKILRDKFLRNKPTAVMSSEQIYQNFDNDKHVVSNFQLRPDAPIVIGYDGGGWGVAFVFLSIDASGNWVAFHEYLPKEKKSIGANIDELLKQINKLRTMGINNSNIIIGADPSAFNTSPALHDGSAQKRAISEVTYIKKMTGITAIKKGAPDANRVEPRISGVEAALAIDHTTGRPFLQVHESCKDLIAGFMGGYSFQPTRTGNEPTNPRKNDYSHIHDALQYAIGVVKAANFYKQGGLTKVPNWFNNGQDVAEINSPRQDQIDPEKQGMFGGYKHGWRE